MVGAFEQAWSVLKADPRQRMYGPPSGGPEAYSVSQTVHPAAAGMARRATGPFEMPAKITKPFNFDSSRPQPFDTFTYTDPVTGQSTSRPALLPSGRGKLEHLNFYERGTPHEKLLAALNTSHVGDFREGATLEQPPYVTSRRMTPEEIVTGEPDALTPMAFRGEVGRDEAARAFRDSLLTAREYGV
tara:strand:- start:239 stop:799 length:561 start_codon:yes stop_codon:yes gene_type:complete